MMKYYLKRAGAYAVDFTLMLLLIGIYLVSYQYFMLDSKSHVYAYFMILCAFLVIFLLLVYLPTINNGRTIGKYIFQLRVINQNGNKRSWYQNLLREFVVKFSLALIFIPADIIYLLIESFQQKKIMCCFAHDHLLKTKVVEEK